MTYLNTTADYGIGYEGVASMQMSMMCDASFANALRARSIGGFVAEAAVGVLAAASKIFAPPLASTGEAELYAAYFAVMQILFLEDVVEFAGYEQT